MEGSEFGDLKKINKKEYGDMIQDTLLLLLTDIGFNIFRENGNGIDSGLDFLATWENNKSDKFSIGFQLKYYKEPNKLKADIIDKFILQSNSHSLDKLLIVSNCGLTEEAIDRLKRNQSDKIEFQNFHTLQRWAESIKEDFKNKYKETEEEKLAKAVVIDFCEKFIKLISENPKILNHIEWRELEKTIARALEGLGFSIELTPPAKDGGKDIIANCTIDGIDKTFIIEMKHWRSNQKVGKKIVKEFVEVIVREKRDKGLILATNGYSKNYLELLSVVERKKIDFAEKSKIIEICQTYERRKSGILLPENLEEFLFRKKEHST